MTEMEADLQRAKIEADAKIKIAEIEAESRLAVAKKTKKPRDIYWSGVIAGLLFVLVILSGIGGAVYQHVNHANHIAQQIEQCQASGGIWTPKIQRVDPGSGNERDEWYEICVK
jgi:hypothetical protein